MQKLACVFLILTCSWALADETAMTTEKIWKDILANGQAYSNLVELTKIGHRINGSSGAAKAVEWGKRKMESYGFDKVWLQPVKVPKWQRGKVERATALLKKRHVRLRIAALGGSVGTSSLTAPVIEVQSLDEVAKLGEQAKGKIIFYNRAMDPTHVNTFEAYGGAIDQRAAGATVASKAGAVGVLVRSLNLKIDDHPHTGVLHYGDDVKPIPAAALSTQAAEELSRLLKQEPGLQVRLELSAHPDGTADSFNVIGELTGREKKDEYVLVGGHLDSWDLAQGAQDDGAGIVQSLETVRAIHALGLHPQRTVRVVLFMGEEMGGPDNGAKVYAREVKAKNEKHVAALESDNGGFTPLGFGVTGGESNVDHLRRFGKYLAPLHADLAKEGDGETDIEPLEKLGVPLYSLVVDSQRYFDYHHAETDTIEAVNARELHLGSAAMAVLVWLLAN